MKKPVFYSELAYLVGLILLAIGTAFIERADFGVSMVVAPAYLLHLKISEFFPIFSFGMAEYTLQAVLLLLMILVVRRVRATYFLSIATAVLYGFLLDLSMIPVGFIPAELLAVRIILFLSGMLLCTSGVSMLFHTYIPPEAYELFVKEVSARYGVGIHKCKTVYDLSSALVAVILSFVFFGFGHFEGIGVGTFVCAVCNGMLIALWTRIFEKLWTYEDRFGLRRHFE